jgi:hypothetical protein
MVDGVEEAIEARGARAVFLPAYSPVRLFGDPKNPGGSDDSTGARSAFSRTAGDDSRIIRFVPSHEG